MQEWRGRKILVIASGGIAVYKTAELVSRLRKEGAEVRVVMTRAATQFVAPLTFEVLSGHPVYLDLFDQPESWAVDHIAWSRWGELAIVAPATANLLAKMAHGLADDAPTTLLLAFQGPVWVAPAMNSAMWAHPATQHNLKLLGERGVRIIQPASGRLACGEVGTGRMAEPEVILHTIELAEMIRAPEGERTGRGGWLDGKRVLITAGPTQEALDAIRFLSNRSSGRMGVAMAQEARARGARVTLVHGPLRVALPEGIAAVSVRSAQEMLEAVQRAWDETDVAVFAAAVANYAPEQAAEGKLKGGETLRLELRRTPDIARWAGEHRRPGQVLIGFAAESERLEEAAAQKMEAKHLDLICANPIGEAGVGFDADQNQVLLLARDGLRLRHPRAPKPQIAAWIWNQVEAWARSKENACQKPAAI